MDERRQILLADDEQGIRDTLGRFLTEAGYDVVTAEEGYEALEKLQEREYFLVLTDIMMPKLNGLELLTHVRENYPQTDVIMITGNIDVEFAIQALRRGAYDYFQKPLNFDKIRITVERVEEAQRLRQTEREMKTLKAAAYETVIGFVQAVEEKDRETKGHSERVGQMTEALGKALGLGDDEIVNCRYAGLLHDVGKIGIPETILNKPSALSSAEFAIIKNHPVMGQRILEPVTFLRDLSAGIRSHHENWDGSGYPDEIAGHQIPLLGRMVRIADVFDGLAMERPYRPPVPLEEVISYIEKNAGTLFDPDLVPVFIRAVVPEMADAYPVAT